MTTRCVEPRFPRNAHVASALAALTLIPLLAGCGGSTAGSTTAPSSPAVETPTVIILPASTSILASQPMSVTVTVSATGSTYPTPTGTVTLSSGSYTSSAIALTSGGAAFAIPASSLAVGSDTLTAAYTPGGSAAANFNSATGTAAVAVSAGNTPTSVTTTSVTYATSGVPFEALAAPNGTVYVGVPSGIQVFSPPVGQTVGVLTATCIDQLSTTLTAESAAVSELSLLPNGVNLAAGINTPGAAFYNLASLQTCTATPNVVSQGTIYGHSYRCQGYFSGLS